MWQSKAGVLPAASPAGCRHKGWPVFDQGQQTLNSASAKCAHAHAHAHTHALARTCVHKRTHLPTAQPTPAARTTPTVVHAPVAMRNPPPTAAPLQRGCCCRGAHALAAGLLSVSLVEGVKG